ncbi:hypothetical protein BDA99DRAFT_541266 [Phascolomyces articulosus]|uniref:Uncharacterized protein n=1 Tax=Phascolomyces articulosus TaxID=60185 RepID=A0AAD5K5P6_9FUNG|nr:hypothetical protein BDA99DRAFT_541266 [Phascolomyces articulosus]
MKKNLGFIYKLGSIEFNAIHPLKVKQSKGSGSRNNGNNYPFRKDNLIFMMDFQMVTLFYDDMIVVIFGKNDGMGENFIYIIAFFFHGIINTFSLVLSNKSVSFM